MVELVAPGKQAGVKGKGMPTEPVTILSSAIRQKKKGIQIRKEKRKTSLYTRLRFLHIIIPP